MPARLDDKQAHEATLPLELGPVRIDSRIITEEDVSGTFGFVQSTNVLFRRKCSGSTQVIQTSDTFSTTNTMGIDKCVIKGAQHVNCSETKNLTTEYMTDFQRMFGNSSCMQIDLKNKFQTFVAFQPDLDRFSGVTKTFIVKYVLNYIEWGWEANAVRDGMSWKLNKSTWQNTTRADSKKWAPVVWTSTLNEQIEEDWISE